MSVTHLDLSTSNSVLSEQRQALGGGRELPPLLFVSHEPTLSQNIGAGESKRVFDLICSSGQSLCLVQNPLNALSEILDVLHRKDVEYEGVVIVGNYDVVPSRRLDTLPTSLRKSLGSTASGDVDNFTIWSDEAYGDLDQNGGWGLPVSRIPDGKSFNVIMNALTAIRPTAHQQRFGIRNSARPFAAGPYALLPGTQELLVSEPTHSVTLGPKGATASAVYVMLHGSDNDATRFWGEGKTGAVEALNLSNIPDDMAGVVFAGCCWGALPVNIKAVQWSLGIPISGRTAETSIAMAYLKAGALAFIGCTGVHYSPTQPPYNYYGGPMHKLFWTNYLAGLSPASALFAAKGQYVNGIPHGPNDDASVAIELKILRQYKCLGLGW